MKVTNFPYLWHYKDHKLCSKMICMPIITNSSIDTDAYFAQLRYRLSGAGKRASLAFSMAEKLIKFWVFFTLLLIGAPGSCAGFKPMLSLC